MATLMVGQVAATSALTIKEKEERGDLERDVFMSLPILAFVVALSSCCTLLAVCSLWCCCRGRSAQPVRRGRRAAEAHEEAVGRPGMRAATAPAVPGGAVAAAAAPGAPATAAAAAFAGEGARQGEGARRATLRRRLHEDTVAEELLRYTVAQLKVELRTKGLLVGGLKEDLVRRLAPAMASEELFKVACSVSDLRDRAIPLEALRSDEELRRWIESGLERWERAT